MRELVIVIPDLYLGELPKAAARLRHLGRRSSANADAPPGRRPNADTPSAPATSNALTSQNAPTPNAPTPNAPTPNARTPNARTPNARTLAGIEHVARFGSHSRLDFGWRPWLATWLGRSDLARAAPASVVAAAGADVAARADVAAGAGVAAGADVAAPADVVARADVAARADVLAGPHVVAPRDGEGASRATHAAVANAVWLATPLHLQAGLTTLFVDRRSLLRLSPVELRELCADFGRVFADSGLRLEPLASGEALLFSPPTLEVTTVEPARFVDGDVAGALPRGSGAGYLRRLGAEIEMWLHEHPVNQARVARRDLPVSTLWLWGNEGVPAPAVSERGGVAQAPEVPQSRELAGRREIDAFGTDAYLQGLCRLLGIASRPLPDSLEAATGGASTRDTSSGGSGGSGGSGSSGSSSSSSRGGGTVGAARTFSNGSTVIVASVGELWRERGTFLDALNEVDCRFIEPAGRAVRRGAYRQVSLLANDRLIVLTDRDHLRLWRRARPGLEALQWT